MLRGAARRAVALGAERRLPHSRRVLAGLYAMVFIGSCIVSCQQNEAVQGAPTTGDTARLVESSPDLFAPDNADTCIAPLTHEVLLVEGPRPSEPTIVRRRPSVKTIAAGHLERSVATVERSRSEAESDVARELEPPVRKDPRPAPTEEAGLGESPAPNAAPDPAPPAKRAESAPPRAASEHDLSVARNVSLAIGLGGVAMGAFAASGDGTPGERVASISYLSVGVAGLATAGILYALDPEPDKGIKVEVGPGMLGLRGRF